VKAGLLLASVTLAATLAGQEIDLADRTGKPSVRATVLATTGVDQTLGYGFLTVDLTNPTLAAEAVELEVTDGQAGARYRAAKALVLAAGGRSRVWVPYPTRSAYLTAKLRAHGVESQQYLPRSAGALRALLIATDSTLIATWSAQAPTPKPEGTKGGTKGKPAASLWTRAPADLPPSWQMLTAFPVIAVDERADGLRREHLSLLADYARAGGTLVLLHAGAMATDSILAAGDGAASLGTVLRTNGDGSAELSGGLVAEAIGRFSVKSPLWPRVLSLPAGLTFPREIPGLARPPVEAFTLLTLAFLLFVLFALYWFVRRKKRPLWLLVVLPCTGFGTAGLTMFFGFVSEGLVIKGTSEAITWLDQDSHRHVTVAGRTLFAPMSPARLAPDARTGLFGEQLPPPGRDRTNHALELDLDQGFLPSGAALPARTPTTFATVTCGETRERIRFQREGGSWRVLAAPGLAPDASRDSVLFRDPEGELWIGAPGKALEPAGSRDASAFLGEAFMPPPPLRQPGRPPMFEGSTIAEGEALRAFLAERHDLELQPGSYLALVREGPLLDSLGLTVDWRGRVHLVLGKLGKEDLIR
jgi:hypothetical protein